MTTIAVVAHREKTLGDAPEGPVEGGGPVVAGNLYRLLALQLPRYQTATPDKIWRHFLDVGGTLHVTDTAVTCALNLRSHHPVLIDAGFADLEVPIPWWEGRTLRFRFPPR